MLEVRPITQKRARGFVLEHHRHAGDIAGWLFGVGLWTVDDELVGVGIAGRPISRILDDGRTLEIIRIATLGHENACSRLYGALCRAGKALGYRRAVTYTLETEPGTGPRAAGFSRDAESDRPVSTWARPSRGRYETDLFGTPVRDAGRKIRWSRAL